ncbi:MAG: hypothetical protein AAFS10_19330 [Myxococcota bacterium]
MTTFRATEDIQRSIEGNHDIAVLQDPTVLVSDARWVPSVELSRDALYEALNELKTRMNANAREAEETRTVSEAIAKLKIKATQQYTFVTRQVEFQLLTLDPDNDSSPDEATIATRAEEFARLFTYTPSELSKLTPEAIAEFFDAVVAGMQGNSDLSALELEGRLATLVPQLREAGQKGKAERDEDKGATQALEAARSAFDRAARAHRDQVRSLLIRQDRLSELGRFVLSQDAAYRGRRRAGVPILEEDGAGSLDADPLVGGGGGGENDGGEA